MPDAVPSSPHYDPVLLQREAAEYLGFRGSDPTRSLKRLDIERTPIPGTGRVRLKFGYRLSVLNQYLQAAADPKSRRHTRAKERPPNAE